MVQDVKQNPVESLRNFMIAIVVDIDNKTMSKVGKKIIEDFISELKAVDTNNEDEAIQKLERISGEFKIKAQKENVCSTEHN